MKRSLNDESVVPEPKKPCGVVPASMTWAQLCQSDFFEHKFGNTKALRASSETAVQECRAAFSRLWPAWFSRGPRAEFPGNLASSIMQSDLLTVLSKKRFYIYPKTDGTRYMLVITKDKTQKPAMYLFDRRMECVQLSNSGIQLRLGAFDGCVLDCELVRGHDGLFQMHVFDALVFGGILIVDSSFQQRMEYVDLFFKKHVVERNELKSRPKSEIVFELIRKMPLNRIYRTVAEFNTKIENYAQDCAYPVDGLIFSDLDARYTPGRNKTALKWKRADENTIDFCMKLTTIDEGDVQLQIMESDEKSKQAYQTMSSDSSSLNRLDKKKAARLHPRQARANCRVGTQRCRRV